MRYKLGDIVTVSGSAVIGKAYGLYLFTTDMAINKGKPFTITNVLEHDGSYRLSDNNGCFYTDEMLEPTMRWKERLSR